MNDSILQKARPQCGVKIAHGLKGAVIIYGRGGGAVQIRKSGALKMRPPPLERAKICSEGRRKKKISFAEIRTTPPPDD